MKSSDYWYYNWSEKQSRSLWHRAPEAKKITKRVRDFAQFFVDKEAHSTVKKALCGRRMKRDAIWKFKVIAAGRFPEGVRYCDECARRMDVIAEAEFNG